MVRGRPVTPLARNPGPGASTVPRRAHPTIRSQRDSQMTPRSSVKSPQPRIRLHDQGTAPEKLFVYTIRMGEHLLRGRVVTDEQIQAWADEAEAGYDLSRLPRPRRGRPPVGEGPGVVVPVRLDEATLAALTARAEAEGLATRSDAVRAAVREWVRSV